MNEHRNFVWWNWWTGIPKSTFTCFVSNFFSPLTHGQNLKNLFVHQKTSSCPNVRWTGLDKIYVTWSVVYNWIKTLLMLVFHLFLVLLVSITTKTTLFLFGTWFLFGKLKSEIMAELVHSKIIKTTTRTFVTFSESWKLEIKI